MNELHILHLYPNEMNTYGDSGNVLTLFERAKIHNLKPIVHHYHIGGALPERVDLVIGGGGQDAAQSDIQTDIKRISPELHKLANNHTPMLMVCGAYQLFGHKFTTNSGIIIEGIGVLDVETFGGEQRMIGNIAIKTKDFGVMYGFENHSGKTVLGKKQMPLGIVTRGNGNNGEDETEGARTNNVFGTYLHGPILPNNPIFADALIEIAAKNNNPSFELQATDSHLSDLVRLSAKNRKY